MGKNPCWVSLYARREAMIRLSFTSAADGHEGPSTLICLLFSYNTLHLSPPPLFSQFSSPAGSSCNWLSNSARSCTMCVGVYLLYAVQFFDAVQLHVYTSPFYRVISRSHHNFMFFYDFLDDDREIESLKYVHFLSPSIPLSNTQTHTLKPYQHTVSIFIFTRT